jgi:hypothetical protein
MMLLLLLSLSSNLTLSDIKMTQVVIVTQVVVKHVINQSIEKNIEYLNDYIIN